MQQLNHSKDNVVVAFRLVRSEELLELALPLYWPKPIQVSSRIRVFVLTAIVVFIALGFTTIGDAAHNKTYFMATPVSEDSWSESAHYSHTTKPDDPAVPYNEMSREEQEAIDAAFETYHADERNAESMVDNVISAIYIASCLLAALGLALVIGPRKSWTMPKA